MASWSLRVVRRGRGEEAKLGGTRDRQDVMKRKAEMDGRGDVKLADEIEGGWKSRMRWIVGVLSEEREMKRSVWCMR
jgi:hypothetical protein